MKKLHYLYADFETTTVKLPKKYENYKDYYEHAPKPKSPQVYSWGILYDKAYGKLGDHNFTSKKVLYDQVNYHYDITGESFINYLENLKVDSMVYFNNLRGFDGHFIIPILDKLGYYNVLPFNIDEFIHLNKNQQKHIKNRLLRVRNRVLKIKKHRDTMERLDRLEQGRGNKYIKNQVSKNWKLLFPHEYSLMTNGGGKIYEIRIGLEDIKRTKKKGKGFVVVKKNRVTILRDSLNLFPTSIAKMGKTILSAQIKKNSKLTEDEFKVLHADKYKILEDTYLKKEIDGGYNRTKLYKSLKELQEDGNELEYLIQDTFILWKFHKLIEKDFPRKDWKLTIGATSYNLWEQSLGESLIQEYYDRDLISDVFLERGAKRICLHENDRLYGTAEFKRMIVKKLLPTKWLNSAYNEEKDKYYDIMYRYYTGGMTFVNEEHRGRVLTNITFIDINSSYPSQMVKETMVPIGTPRKGDVKSHPFKYYRLTPKKKIVNKDGLPFLFNALAEKREYLKELLPGTVYRFTSITLPYFLEYYKCDENDYELEIEFSFRQKTIIEIFGPFILYWYKVKEHAAITGQEILKMIAKLFMNNTYGKLATKMIRDCKAWLQDMEEWADYKQVLEPKYYLPLGTAITELGRMQLVHAVGHNYKNVVYGDTDSIAIIDFKKEDYPNVDLHPTELGKWDIEFENGAGVFRRTKQYMLLNEKKHKIAFSGINFDRFLLSDLEVQDLEQDLKEFRNISLADFINGKKITSQLQPYKLLGSGIILQELSKEIKPVWSYDPLSEQKYFSKEHFKDEIHKINKLKINNMKRLNNSNKMVYNYIATNE